MFSQASVCSQEGSHYDALDLTEHTTPLDMEPWYLSFPHGYQTWDLLPPLVLTSGGHHWKPVQTCPPPQPLLTGNGGN